MNADFVAVNCIITDAAGGAPSSSTGPTTRDIQPGEHVVICIGVTGSGATPSAVSVGGLSLSQDETDTATFTFAQVWSGRATALIASGSTVTVTMNGTFRDIICFSLINTPAASYIDVSDARSEGAGNATPDTPATQVAVAAGSIVIAFWRGMTNLANPVTPGPGYTEVPGSDVVGQSGADAQQVQYKKLVVGGPEQATCTPNAAPSYEYLFVAYAGTPDNTETIAVPYARSSGPAGPF